MQRAAKKEDSKVDDQRGSFIGTPYPIGQTLASGGDLHPARGEQLINLSNGLVKNVLSLLLRLVWPKNPKKLFAQYSVLPRRHKIIEIRPFRIEPGSTADKNSRAAMRARVCQGRASIIQLW